MRTVATPFGATAPLKPVFDASGRQTGTEDWPLRGTQSLELQVDYDDQGVPRKAGFTWTETGRSSLASADPLSDTTVNVGPGQVTITVQHEPGAAPGPVTGVTFVLDEKLFGRTVTMTTVSADDGTVHLRVTENDLSPADFFLFEGDSESAGQGTLQLGAKR